MKNIIILALLITAFNINAHALLPDCGLFYDERFSEKKFVYALEKVPDSKDHHFKIARLAANGTQEKEYEKVIENAEFIYKITYDGSEIQIWFEDYNIDKGYVIRLDPDLEELYCRKYNKNDYNLWKTTIKDEDYEMYLPQYTPPPSIYKVPSSYLSFYHGWIFRLCPTGKDVWKMKAYKKRDEELLMNTYSPEWEMRFLARDASAEFMYQDDEKLYVYIELSQKDKNDKRIYCISKATGKVIFETDPFPNLYQMSYSFYDKDMKRFIIAGTVSAQNREDHPGYFITTMDTRGNLGEFSKQPLKTDIQAPNRHWHMKAPLITFLGIKKEDNSYYIVSSLSFIVTKNGEMYYNLYGYISMRLDKSFHIDMEKLFQLPSISNDALSPANSFRGWNVNKGEVSILYAGEGIYFTTIGKDDIHTFPLTRPHLIYVQHLLEDNKVLRISYPTSTNKSEIQVVKVDEAMAK